ncbi:UNVERIFIED_CONTAM: hypothetical protein RMT77_018797 [Armadillidium vulgare]
MFKFWLLLPSFALLGLSFLPLSQTADVDGQWSPWGVYSTNCTKSCGGGTQTEYRSCSNPAPSGSGARCKMENGTQSDIDERKVPCNTKQCITGGYYIYCDNCTIGRQYYVYTCDGNDTECTDHPRRNESCNRWNIDTCPSTCSESNCPDDAVCTDTSTKQKPSYKCECTMGTQYNEDKTACIRPPPPQPTRRPIPTLAENEKTIATVISKTASSVLIFFVTITLLLFLALRIFTSDRIIQMNMEIALLCAHILLVLPSSLIDKEIACKIVSILTHFFFTACFCFMMLEALHMYSLVAFVVKSDGMFNKFQNTIIGWFLAASVVLVCICFQYDNYGGEYHCWLRMDTPLMLGELIPILILSIITLTLTEAAGSAEYIPLEGMKKKQLLSAKISQRTNLVILFFVIAHMLVGMLSEYEQNLPLYGTFSVLNGVTGALVFFLHCTNNQRVRQLLLSFLGSVRYG